jgi:predicted nuclease of predicted toxin-antitoxin system
LATSGGIVWNTALTVASPPSVLPNRLATAAATMKEGKQRQDGEVGEIACVNEPVVVDADRDALGDFERVGARLHPFALTAEIGARPGEPLAPRLR